jgi:hypothetical protein
LDAEWRGIPPPVGAFERIAARRQISRRALARDESPRVAQQRIRLRAASGARIGERLGSGSVG